MEDGVFKIGRYTREDELYNKDWALMNTGIRVSKALITLMALGLAAGCACGTKSRRGANGYAAVSGENEVILMRLDQMQAEMDSRFAMVEQRIDQRMPSYAPTTSYPSTPYSSTPYVSSGTTTGTYVAPAATMIYPSTTSSVPVTTMESSLPGAPVAEESDYYNTSQYQQYSLYPDTPIVQRTSTSSSSGSSRGSMIRVRGVTARDVQSSLKSAGFDPGAIDGKAGRRTQAAIRDFQRSSGLTVDGIVGPKTWETLQYYLPAGGGSDVYSTSGTYNSPLK